MLRILCGLLAAGTLLAQVRPTRVQLHPLARPEFDRGPVPADFDLGTMTLMLERTPQQQADLERLLEEQRDPASPNYHRWLTPEEFGARFGATDADIARTQFWLEAQGLRVESVGRGRGLLTFRGKAGEVGRAFATEIHRYATGDKIHYANSREALLPANLPIGAIMGLHDFHPKPLQRSTAPTQTADGSHVLTPADLAVIYNTRPLLQAGIDGTGVKIAVTSQTDLDPADLQAYREQYHLPPVKFRKVQFGTTAGNDVLDILEINLDVDLVSAVAPNAEIIVVYGSGALNSLAYAIDQNVGHVVSNSFVNCETWDPQTSSLLRASVQQGNAQGITVISGTSDSGATSCDDSSGPVSTKGLRITVPGSIPEVTAVGGTQFDEGKGTYWAQTPDANGALALGYIPEIAWNGSGGGFSRLFAKPAWQTGPGVPNDGARDVPDVSFAAASGHDAYVYRSAGEWGTVGGTSASGPVFAGIVGLLNHYLVSQGSISRPGLGNINPALYRLAQSTPNAFHDITGGDNIRPCPSGTPDCVDGKVGYAAGPRYDLASGLGSVDADRLIRAWDARSTVGTVVTLTSSVTTATLDDFITLTATVRPATGAASLAGTVDFYLINPFIDFGANWPLGSVTLDPAGRPAVATLRLQAAVLAAARGEVGRFTIAALYGGSPTLNGSAGTADVSITLPAAAGSAVLAQVTSYAPRFPALSNGAEWNAVIRIQELAGVATRVTSILAGGFETISFFPDTTIPAKGFRQFSVNWLGAKPPETLSLVISGMDANGTRWTRQTSVVLGIFAELTRVFFEGLTNGASFEGSLAPGMLTSAFGRLLSTSTAAATSLPLPQRLGDTTVTVNDVPAPLYFASSGQLNFQIPYETRPGPAILKTTTRFPTSGQEYTTSYSFTVSPSAPGIFAGPNNTLVPFASGKRNDTLVLFITGDGNLDPPLATGRGPDPSTPLERLPRPQLPVRMTIGGVDATILFAGVPPGLAGVTQVNFTIPPNAPLGLQPVVVRVGNASSKSVNLTIAN